MGNSQFSMASEWMENGNINEFIKARGDANRFELVGISLPLPIPAYADCCLIPLAQRCHLRIGIHPQLENGPWGSEGGRSQNTGFTFLFPNPHF